MIKFRCPTCSTFFKISDKTALHAVTCGTCNAQMLPPEPGIGRGLFACWGFGKYLLAMIIAAAFKDAAWVILGLVVLPLNAYIVFQRIRNIGISPWWTLLCMNIIGMIYLCVKASPRVEKLTKKKKAKAAKLVE